MNDFFTIDILSPNKVIVKDLVATSFLVPTSQGQINILPEHTHILTSLGVGVLSIFTSSGGVDRHFSISGGMCKVLNNKVQILTQASEESSSIDQERAQRSLDNVESILNSGDNLTDIEIEKYRNKKERALLRIQLAKKYK